MFSCLIMIHGRTDDLSYIKVSVLLDKIRTLHYSNSNISYRGNNSDKFMSELPGNFPKNPKEQNC